MQPDVNFNKGLLVPRLTTVQRNTIAPTATENSLLIFNTTTQCFEAWSQPTTTWVAFGCIGCTVPSGVTATATPSPICAGSTLTLTGAGINVTGWSWTGPNGFTSVLQSPTLVGITTAGAGVYTLAASNNCGSVTANTVSVVVTAAPTVAVAGLAQNLACGLTTATLAGNTPTTGTGLWSVVSGTATISSPTLPTSGITGLAAAGTVTLRWTISNAPCTPSTNDVVITTSSCFTGCIPTASTVLIPVTSPTGRIWMDRNLGASQVATSSTDAAAYGCLYQWGRAADGHEDRASVLTATNATTAVPNLGNAWDGLFITESGAPVDWLVPQDNTLWQGVAGTNNPCPALYRLPTDVELNAERLTWSSNNAAGAFASPLKLSMSGIRLNNGTLSYVGTNGFYWSSTISTTLARFLDFITSNANVNFTNRANGLSVRCIKN